MIIKPMLAASMEDSKGNPMLFSDLKYPLGASIKLDGIRCLRVKGQTLSRSFKQIPNKYIQEQMKNLPDGLDGELVTYNEDDTCRTFNQVQGDVMREDGEPNFRFEIFDYVKDDLDKPYQNRMEDLKKIELSLPSFCKPIYPEIIFNEAELLAMEERSIAAGHEGIMTRNLKGGYKCGRATFKSQDLIKIKRFVDSEAIILGFEEKLRNENEAEVDELGHTKRSSAKAGMVPANTLGTLLVRDIYSNVEFGIGTGIGLNDELKKKIWENREFYLKKMVKYRYQKVGSKVDPLTGKLTPRIPSFQGFRHEDDM
jgi:DNA ligase-1